jgi:hypothetical protein
VAVRLFALGASELCRSAACSLSIGFLACGLICIAPLSASADDDAPRPTPRTAITIGGASVVLVATKDKIYAFVDRIEDNAPIEDAQLELDTAEGTSINMHRAPITMNKATAGLFVGPFNRAGHRQDAFMVTLRSSPGDGQEPAEITYTDIRTGTPCRRHKASKPNSRWSLCRAVSVWSLRSCSCCGCEAGAGA